MGLGDGANDGESQAGAVAAGAAVDALEGLEEAGEGLGVEDVTVVDHLDEAVAVAGGGRDRDVPARAVVADGVLHKVGHEALEQAAAPIDPYPYDRATLTGNGIAQQCLYWPGGNDPPPRSSQLPDVPTLLFAGGKDLSTPMEWAQRAVTHAPHGKLIIADDAGHGVQSQDVPEAIDALRALVASLR